MRERLYNIRNQQNKTQKQIAEYAGITIRYYQYIECGKRQPTVNIAIKIAEVLNAPVQGLFN